MLILNVNFQNKKHHLIKSINQYYLLNISFRNAGSKFIKRINNNNKVTT